MKERVNNKLIALTQVFILSIAIIAFSFIFSAQSVSAESPSLRTIPGGRSTDPYTTQQIKALSQMSAEEVYGKYEGMKVSAEDQIIEGPSQNLFDIGAYLGLGVSAASYILSTLAVQTVSVATLDLGVTYATSSLPSTTTSLTTSFVNSLAGQVFNIAAGAFSGGQMAKLVLNLAGASDRNLQVASTGAYVGAAASTLTSVFLIGLSTPGIGWISAGLAFVGTFIWQAFGHQTYSRELFTYKPGLWMPQPGGEHCDECNTLEYGCSEYQCKTYGAACNLINPDTDDALCVWENKGDIAPPTVKPMIDSLLTADYSYVPTQTGSKVTYNGGCLPAFEGMTAGIVADKPSQCRYDIERKNSFDDMAYATNFGITAYLKEHRIAFGNSAFPSQYAAESLGLTVNNGEDIVVYFWCESVNGIPMATPYTVSFCIDDSPDLTPPKITSTTPIDDSFITAGTTSMPFYVYTNEPANCSWDFNDVDYKSMAYPMNNCSENAADYKTTSYAYGCIGNLTGLKDNFDNKYYIKCKDKPSLNESDKDQKEKRVANQESFVLNLKGTKELVIDKVTINGKESGIELKDSTNQVGVEIIATTSQGAEKNGNARCSYRRQGEGLEMQFANDGSIDFMSTNTQRLNLFEGYYDYEIKCCDKANNCDSEPIEFTVKSDVSEPLVARAYRDSGQMKVITTEYANCVYGTGGCSYAFDDGTKLSTVDHLDHTTGWDTDTDKYIKCEDQYGNQPGPAECSIIVRGYEGY